ncbi:MAG: hemerythrin domain-containing protein [Desulfurococcales archaeon]|nr:hemerythrin domain-containing protein [Desulfurococcales archaeon]
MTGAHLVNGLIEDHEHIEEALSLLMKAVDLLSKDKISPDVIEELATFLSKFADQCHHGKEELILFPLMEKKGVPVWGGPIGVMLCEHGMGRYFLRNLLRALKQYKEGQKDVINEIVDYAESYYRLLLEHIDKENNVLFPMAQEVVGENEGIEEAERIEAEMNHEEMLRKLDEIKKTIELFNA